MSTIYTNGKVFRNVPRWNTICQGCGDRIAVYHSCCGPQCKECVKPCNIPKDQLLKISKELPVE